jgi:ATP-dependent DNA helicase RecQ
MADEDTSQFWRLRETQALVSWLRAQNKQLIDSADILQWLDTRAPGPWWSLLREALAAYVLETSGAELPAEHFFEWLAEWGREFRRKQQGLLLLTAHRAKGLEFDHVAVLDGTWDRTGKNEDADAARRLYYVAMTRARKTLLLARFDQEHVLLKAIPERPCIIRRPVTLLPAPAAELTRQFQRLSLEDVYIDYAGGYEASHQLHRKISELEVGDALQLVQKKDRWELANSTGTTVGKLAKAYSPPANKQLVSGKVTAIITRLREDTKPEYQDRIRCDRWEVVLAELVFA